MKRLFILASAVVSMLIFNAARANTDKGLYEPKPPKNSAFIRFINDREGAGEKESKINGKTYDLLKFSDVSRYYVVKEGGTKISLGDVSHSFNVSAGDFYSAVLQDDKTLNVIKDERNDNRAKAQITFYNLSDMPDLSVKTSSGEIEIISSLDPNHSSARQINPLSVSIGVFKDGQLFKDLGKVHLKNAASYSIVASSPDIIKFIQATTDTRR